MRYFAFVQLKTDTVQVSLATTAAEIDEAYWNHMEYIQLELTESEYGRLRKICEDNQDLLEGWPEEKPGSPVDELLHAELLLIAKERSSASRGIRMIVYGEDGAEDLGLMDVGELHDVIHSAVGD